MSENMRAVGFTEFGEPEVLGIVPLPVPSPGPGQVRVRVAAAAVNPTDLAFRAGAHRSMPAGMQPPYVPGMDLAGVIDAANAAGDWPVRGARSARPVDTDVLTRSGDWHY